MKSKASSNDKLSLEEELKLAEAKKAGIIKPFWKYFVQRKWVFIFSIITMAVTDVFSLVTPVLLGEAIDRLNHWIAGQVSVAQIRYLVQLLLIIVAANVILWICRFYWRKFNYSLGPLVESDLRLEFLDHIQKLSPNFYVHNRTGELMSRASSDIQQVANFMQSGSIIFFDSMAYLLMVPAILFYLNWRLTLWIVIPLPILLLLTRFITKKIFLKTHAMQEQEAELSVKVQENFAGVKVIKSFTREESEINKFNKLNIHLMEKSLKLYKTLAYFQPLLALLVDMIFLLVWFIGGLDVIKGNMTLGEFVTYNLALHYLTWPMIGVGWSFTMHQMARASMIRINKVLKDEPDIFDNEDAIEDIDVKGDIEFRNLTFCYPPGSPNVLKNVSLKIQKGSTVALVGPVGCGKTTMIDILPRFYDPPEGTVFIDGIDIKKIKIGKLRSSIGYVPQEPFLFSFSIQENIGYGLEAHDISLVRNAAQDAMVHQDIENFKHKYDQVLGERGVTLSGGQKQRATIARATVIEPPILILDDALSSVDTNTEELILENLKNIRKERTCIISAHRISTIKDADIIVVLSEGEIVEQGTHDELVELNGMYNDMYQKQLLQDELGIE